MEFFPPLYKKMCEKAEIIQSKWEPKNRHYYIEKGDYEGSEDMFNLKLIHEDISVWKSKHTWLPTEKDLKLEFIYSGIPKLDQSADIRIFKLFEDEGLSKIDSYRKREETKNILVLKFAMREHGFVWDDEKGEWKDS